jgi:hypothetical protein
MKAWEEIEQLHGRFICETLKSRFFIDGGLRIERMNNGTFILKNTMTNHDHYEDASQEVWIACEFEGWHQGMYLNQLSVHNKRLEKANYLVELASRNEDNMDRLQILLERKNMLLEKIQEIYQLYSNLPYVCNP